MRVFQVFKMPCEKHIVTPKRRPRAVLALAGGAAVWAGLMVAAASGAAPARPPEAPGDARAFAVAAIEKNCLDCHDAGSEKGGMRLDPAALADPAADPQRWERVVQKLSHRQMPPVGEPRPDEATYNRLLAYLESSLDDDAARKPQPGRTATFRRLTRTEYHNAVRDLLALDTDVAALLPKDEVSHGFDNVTVGELSPTLLERYLGAAKSVAAAAIGWVPKEALTQTHQVPVDLTQELNLADLPPGSRGGATAGFHLPADGEYEISLRLARDRNEKVEGLRRVHQLDLLVDGAPVQRFTVTPAGRGQRDDELVDRNLHFRLRLSAGEREIAGTFVPVSAALPESEREPNPARFNADRHPRTQPALYSITVLGPFNSAGPGDTPSRRRIFGGAAPKAGEEDARAREIVARLARLAFRRPVTGGEIAGLMRFYSDAKKQEGFEAGVELALRAMLVSPNFLFRVETDPAGAAPGAVHAVPDLQLASRLSFFLWSSLPDEPLLALAEQGRLREPAVLRREVGRMLADPRAESLVTSFAAQWLYLRNLEWVSPDARLFMGFDDNLRQAMRRETELFFGSVLREDRSVLDLLRADYTFLNERLAAHYGVPGVQGSQFRRVTLPPDGDRGGLLTHASILTVTSHPNRTSPVLRGSWILGSILGTPPKPPPPNVPQLKEKTDTGRPLSLREQIAKHRENATCAACHDLMDPVGAALDHYDAIGRWRDSEGGEAVVTTGALPDGTTFNGARELERAILKRPELFAQTVAGKLLTYALGRGVELQDAPAVRKIVRDAAPDGYRLSDLVVGVVQSVPFQMRTSP